MDPAKQLTDKILSIDIPTDEPRKARKSADEALLLAIKPQLDATLRALCAKDFLIFQRVELGMEIGYHHKLWAHHLSTKNDVCEMAPRDHGKSLSWARALPIWRAKYDPFCKDILILGADQSSAVENLDKMKVVIQSRESLRGLMPSNREDGMNSRTELRLNNGVNIKAMGYRSPLRGRHPQLIILDDVLNERNSITPIHRAETKDYFFQVVFPMKDKGMPAQRARGHYSQIVVVGTAQDKEDLYHDLMKNEGFSGKKLRAVTSAEHRTVLWPERYSFDDLMKIKNTVGSIRFAREYQNEPLSDDATIFPPSLFGPLLDPNLSYAQAAPGNGLPTFMGVDFSVPGSTDGDWTVIFIAQYDAANSMFIPLNYWRARPTEMQAQLHQVELWCQLYNVTLGFLEDNLFQRVYAEHFKNKTSLPLQGHTVTHGKKVSVEYGILSFRPQFENGRWVFPYKTPLDREKTDLIIAEFNGIVQKKGRIGNESFHDDIVMAMWHMMMASKGTSFSVSWG